ncbi:OadG family protein [Pseudoalteromonas piscicida]|uniref:Probable oxaloacetate decarboxylase gamma chain n=1 Tax=Pseudoalteromonas piscicida TaxID=43662 RepID=A0A2A5JNQ0_PSEO7|nr:OadG family transporter subunit [Pseudoalteromonas piscicida]PCK31038.1 oxaloacetate decarboxylase [Pseudoalteromonas piscicida]
MDIGSQLLQAGNLMLTGMVGVFVFLSILIFAMRLLANFAAQFKEVEPSATRAKATKTISSQGVPQAHIAAISAAVATYRKNN